MNTRKETEAWLHNIGIRSYIIKDDLTVDVIGNVLLYCKNLDYIPVQFGVVSENFSCSDNFLTSLKGCPTKVGWHFDCDNNNLTSLEHCPTKVGGYFSCENNMIVSEMPEDYNGENNPSWETDDPELISSRFFDKLEGLDFDTKVDVLNILKETQPEFYNSASFQTYNPESMLNIMKRSIEATGGLFNI